MSNYISDYSGLQIDNIIGLFQGKGLNNITGAVKRNSDGSFSSASASDIGAQAILVSGTNIKTINNTSLLGSGNISITIPTVDQTYNSTSTNAQSGVAVASAIAAMPEPMLFKGSLGTGGTITSLPTASSSNEGYVYKVITDGTYASQAAKVGDTFISDGSTWVLIPSGDEPSGTVTSVGLNNATDGGLTISGSPIISNGSITVGHTNTLSSAQTTEAVYPIKIDKNGHISSYGSAVTLGTAAAKEVTDNSINKDVTSSDTNLITGRTLYYQLAKKGYTTNTGTVTSVATGVGLTGGPITSSGIIKANLNSETSLGTLGTTDGLYAVGVDSNGKLAVSISTPSITYSTTDLTAGTSPLTTGEIYLVYEA